VFKARVHSTVVVSARIVHDRRKRGRDLSHLSRRKNLRKRAAKEHGLPLRVLEWRDGILFNTEEGVPVEGVPEVPKRKISKRQSKRPKRRQRWTHRYSGGWRDQPSST